MLCTRKPIFHVGDKVRIVDEPYDQCPFSWVERMSRYCGKTATIVRVVPEVDWADTDEEGYRIDADGKEFMWCANCFEPIEDDLLESDVSVELLFGGASA